MRKATVLLIIMILIPASLYAVGFQFTHGLESYGEKDLITGESDGGIALSAAFRFPDSNYIAPALSVDVNFGAHGFHSVRTGMDIRLYRVLDTAFRWAVSNPAYYAPSIGIGYQYSGDHMMYIEASPIRIESKTGAYEFMSPFITLDFVHDGIRSWGIRLFQFSHIW